MSLKVEKISLTTLRHKIVIKVREAILSGSLKPGERVVERDLALQLGTSLTATREALIQLEAEGLITKRPNSTTHVTELSHQDIEQIFQVRRILEEHAFLEACRHGKDAEIVRLRAIHKRALAAAKRNDAQAYIELDFEFHEAIWIMSGNHYLVESLKRIVLPLFGFSLIGLAARNGFDLHEDALVHAPLMEAIAEHNLPALKKAFQIAAKSWFTSTDALPPEARGAKADGNKSPRTVIAIKSIRR